MATVDAAEKELKESQAAVNIQGDTVRSLKAALKDGKADKVRPSEKKIMRPTVPLICSDELVARAGGCGCSNREA
jgi:hypothetical protein